MTDKLVNIVIPQIVMETEFSFLERGGTGRGTYWTLRYDLHCCLSSSSYPERGRRIDWEAVKTRVLKALKERTKRRKPGL